MLANRLLILLLFVLFFSCSKEEITINNFTGNDIDSIVYYTVSSNDTVPSFAFKFSYSSDKKIITEQWYERIEGNPNLIPSVHRTIYIQSNRIIIESVFLSDTTIETYVLNNSNCVISRTIRTTNNFLLDSTVYSYSNDNYLQLIQSYNFISPGESPTVDTLTSEYYWSNKNIAHTKHSRRSKWKENNHISNINYTISNIRNPLNYNYLDRFHTPYFRYGKSSEYLISNEIYYDDSTSSNNFRSYKMFPNENAYLTSRSQGGLHYKIFYK